MPKFKVDNEKSTLREAGIPHIIEEKGQTGSGTNTYWEAHWSCGWVTINNFGKRSIKPCSPSCIVFNETKSQLVGLGIPLEIKW